MSNLAQAIETSSVTPLERDGLVALLQAQDFTLRRHGRGFVAAPVYNTSGPTLVHAVSKRMAIRMEGYGLIVFDDRDCPGAITLTEQGKALATALHAQQQRVRAANDDAATPRRGETSPWRRTNACVTRKAMQSAARIRQNERNGKP